jgi:hypothetical protein
MANGSAPVPKRGIRHRWIVLAVIAAAVVGAAAWIHYAVPAALACTTVLAEVEGKSLVWCTVSRESFDDEPLRWKSADFYCRHEGTGERGSHATCYDLDGFQRLGRSGYLGCHHPASSEWAQHSGENGSVIIEVFCDRDDGI